MKLPFELPDKSEVHIHYSAGKVVLKGLKGMTHYWINKCWNWPKSDSLHRPPHNECFGNGLVGVNSFMVGYNA